MQELTRIRNERGWSQQKLSDVAKVNKATINQIERGRRSPNVETLEKLAVALGVELGDFFPKAQAQLRLDLAGEQLGSKKTADALVILLKDLIGWGEALIEDLRSSTGEFPLTSVGEFTQNSWAVRALYDDAAPEVRGAARVSEAMRKLGEVESRLNPLVGQWFGPGELDPEQWSAREKFARAWSETQRRREAAEQEAAAAALNEQRRRQMNA
ncbi:MAG: helix-turn-helix domain-containing protein [Actinomycetota bacterium]|nr:helix-turn-helix domain-containing protein [Actinomycetota bacterium]